LRTDELEVSHAAGGYQLGIRQQTGGKNGNGYGGVQVISTQQQRNLQKIMAGFDSDYRIAEVLHARQVELQETLKTEYLLPAFDNLRRAGVRQDVINAALESVEFEESLAAFISELTGIVGKWDLADQIDSARTAA